MRVILASASPRRKELLAQLIPEFSVVVSAVDEDSLTLSDPWQTAMRLAHAKAMAVGEPGALVLGADTVVALPDGTQLTKPVDREDAIRMLQALSGRTHHVITGVCLAFGSWQEVFQSTSTVTFLPLSGDQIAAYVDTGEPMDKAGGYAIQGGAAPFVECLEGSLSNVIGLPLERLEAELERLFSGLAQSPHPGSSSF